MWVLAGLGCHLFSSGAISGTCDDAEGCGDDSGTDTAVTGPEFGDPERLFVALTCTDCNGTLDARYVADLWILPDQDGALPALAQSEPWSGPIATDPSSGRYFVASGSSITVMGPTTHDLAAYGNLLTENILDVVSVSGLVLLTTGATVYRWNPDLGRDGLTTVVDDGSMDHWYAHLVRDGADAWAADVAKGRIDLWRIDVGIASLTLEMEAFAPDGEAVSAGIFSGKDGALGGCDAEGEIVVFDGAGSSTSLGAPGDVDAVGCGYDPGLAAHVVFDATRGILVQPDGDDVYFAYAGVPNDGDVLVGTVAIP